jgi:thiol-disulfide isomerase/thioredoxin
MRSALGLLRRSALPLAVLALAALFVWRSTLGAPLQPPRTPGELAPLFALPDLRGQELSLAGLRGRLVLVNFWATWCPPCRAELPALEELSRDRPGCLAVVGVAVNSGDALAVGAFAAERALTYPMLIDDGSAARSYRVVTLPHSVLVGPDGLVVGTFHGKVTARGVAAAVRAIPQHIPSTC